MHPRRLSLLVPLFALSLSASGQSVGQIPVTQAGLVPSPGYNSLTPDHKVPPVVPPTGVAPSSLASSPASGSASQITQGLMPRVPPFQLLPGYVVRENDMPEIRPRDVYSKKGLEDLSFREHPGLHVGNFHNSNSKQADVLFQEDKRLEEIQDFKDTARAIGVGGDSVEASGILKATNDAFARDEDNMAPSNDIMNAPAPRAGTLLGNIEQMRLTWLEDRF